jgi:hypothetical protein
MTEFTALHATDSATGTTGAVQTDALVGNPRRTRGLDASVLRPRKAASDMARQPAPHPSSGCRGLQRRLTEFRGVNLLHG